MYDKKEKEIEKELIKINFNEQRRIKKEADEEIQLIAKKHSIDAIIFETEDGELISCGVQNVNFDNREVTKYMKYGEELYEKNGKPITIYLLGSPHIKYCSVHEVESEARVILKIAMMQYSSTYDTLRHIKELVDNRIKLDEDDLFALSMIPMMGPPEDKRNLRRECLELWKIINKKGLIQ